jgi:Bacterial TSP3 repeat
MRQLSRAKQRAPIRPFHLVPVALVILVTAIRFPGGAEADAPRQAPEPVTLEGPTEIEVRNLPDERVPPGQNRVLRHSRRHPSSHAHDHVGTPPTANVRDESFSPEPLAPPVPSGTGFEGVDNTDNGIVTGFTVTPPDPQVAVGPDHVFEMVNIVGRIYTRSGGTVQTFSLASFFGVPSGFLDTDPKVFYDALSGRWFGSYVSYRDLSGGVNDQGRLHLAISQTNDPTGVWNLYFLSYAQVFPDYQGMGVTDDKFTISANIFDIDQSFYHGVETLVFEKADVLAGVPGPSVGLVAFPRNTSRFTVRPAQSLSSTSDQYMTFRNTATTLTVIRITGTPDAGNVVEASATNLPMLAQNAPPASVALGGTIDSGDSRLLDAMWRNGRLWTSASAACLPAGDSITRSCAHVIEVNTGAPPTLLQDIMFGASGEYFSWPALRTDASGDLYVSLSHTNASIFAEARVTGRPSTDPPNTMSGSTLLRAGTIAHDSNRWGDYLAAAVDPKFPECVWLIGEYAKNTSGANWGTFIARTSYSAGCDTDNDGWSDGAEAAIGTDPLDACADTLLDDAWPADVDNDTFSDITDISALTGVFGEPVPPAPARYDIGSEPPDGFVDITDVSRMTGLFGQSCGS